MNSTMRLQQLLIQRGSLFTSLMSPFQNIDILMPQTCEYVTVCGKRDCAVVINDLEWGDYPGKPGWAQCNYKGLYKRRQEGEKEKEMIQWNRSES